MKQTILMPNFRKKRGKLPAIIQEKGTGVVLMPGTIRSAEFREMLKCGEVVLYSMTRKKRWKKGEEKSGNILKVHDIRVNCNRDAVLIIVTQTRKEVGLCHTGKPTCFYRSVFGSALEAEDDRCLQLLPVVQR